MLFLLESFILALVTCTFVSVQAKYVFAHFVVSDHSFRKIIKLLSLMPRSGSPMATA